MLIALRSCQYLVLAVFSTLTHLEVSGGVALSFSLNFLDD
jgi:hypothetical protein